MNSDFQIKPCDRNSSNEDLFCASCDRNIVKVDDETTGNFYMFWGTERRVDSDGKGGWKSRLTDRYEQFVWACCTDCLERGQAKSDPDWNK